MAAQPRELNLSFMPMCAADLDAVAEGEARIYSYPWTRGNFSDSLASGHSLWVCRLEGELIGYAVMMIVLDEAHLLNLSIVPERQTQGFGRALLMYLCDVAREARARQMFLEVRPSNVAAQSLYRSLGFHSIGRRRGYYPAQYGREDAIVMALPL